MTQDVLTFADELRNCGVEEYVDLPQIIVVGDQSSGKSSVLEAISGAPLPRSDGLTTRCAIQLTLRNQSEWKAEVRTREPNDGVSNATKVTTVKELGEAVHKAQIALCGDDNGFAPDSIVEVKMWGPDVPNLTLIDLPGLIRTSIKGQSESVKDDVRKMVKRYMKGPRSIILAVIAANVDIATTEVIELAQAVDPDGERTIGVLTKPDLVDTGAEGGVLRILRNESKPLTHGYWMVRNRGQAQVTANTSPEEARKAEQQYFDEHFTEFRERTGVIRLTEMLTTLLVRHITQSLYPVKNELEQLYSTACDEHREMGESPPTTPAECRQRLLAINKWVIDQLRQATSNNGTLTTHMSSLHSDAEDGLRARTLATRPRFVMKMMHVTYLDNEKRTWEMKIAKHHLHLDGSSAWLQKKVKGKLQLDVTIASRHRRKRYTAHIDDTQVILSPLTLPVSAWDTDEEAAEESFKVSTKEFRLNVIKGDENEFTPSEFLTDVKTNIAKHRGRALPNFPSFDVFVNYMREYVDNWEKPTKEIAQTMCAHADTLLTDVVAKDPTLSKHQMLRILVQKCLREVRKELETLLVSSLDIVLANERQPSTVNHYYMDTLNKIRNRRLTLRIDNALDDDKQYSAKEVRTIIAGVTAQTVGNVSNDTQEAQDMVDSLRSYWKVANKRFVDNVRQCLDEAFVKQLADKCDKALGDRLMSLDNANQLFGETASTIARRTKVNGRMRRLKAAVEKCAKFVSPLEGLDAMSVPIPAPVDATSEPTSPFMTVEVVEDHGETWETEENEETA